MTFEGEVFHVGVWDEEGGNSPLHLFKLLASARVLHLRARISHKGPTEWYGLLYPDGTVTANRP